LPYPEKLTTLHSYNNDIQSTNLEFLRSFTNLKDLTLGNNSEQEGKEKIQQSIYNRFYGSLKPLERMSGLRYLYINNTDIDSDLEYLPDSINDFHCLADLRKDAKVKTIYNLLQNIEGNNFSQKLQAYKQKLQEQSQQPQILQPNLPKK